MDYYPETQTIDVNAQVVEPLRNLMSGIIGFIPTLIIAIGILLIGWIVSKIVASIIKNFLISIRFDKIAQTTGLTEVINESKIGMTPSDWTAKVFYYFGLFLTWIIAFDSLKLKIPSLMFQEIGGFLSTLFMALVILLIGLFLSTIISKFVKATSTSLGIANAGVQAGIIQWAIILFTFIAGLSRLGLPEEFLLIILSAIGIALCVTLTIAFGVGSIPVVPRIIEKIIRK
ncbi:MAG: hypothetical protein AB1650_08985 [Candidatus Omnitrophota bacterium]